MFYMKRFCLKATKVVTSVRTDRSALRGLLNILIFLINVNIVPAEPAVNTEVLLIDWVC